MAAADPLIGKIGGELTCTFCHLTKNDALDAAFIKGSALQTAAVRIIGAAILHDLPALMDMAHGNVIKAMSADIGRGERTAGASGIDIRMDS